jgi:Undecaprenyl-phosphate glucose phosphotransferase
MLKRYHRVIGGVFRLVDAGVIGLAWLAAYWLRFDVQVVAVTKEIPSFGGYAALTPLVMVLWSITLAAMGVYQGRRMLRRTHEAHLLLRAHGAAMLFFIALTYMISDYKYSRAVMLTFGGVGAFGLVVFRLVLRNGLRQLRRRGLNLRYVLAVGEGKPLETLIARMDKFPELGLRVVGVVAHESQSAQELFGKPVLGRFGDLKRIAHETRADQVLIALPRHQYPDLDRLLRALSDETVGIQIVPDVHEYVTLGCEVEDFDGLPIVNLNDSPLNGWGAIAKRITDAAVAAVALALLSPVFALIAFAVRLSSPGPIFYGQDRMGLDGRTFRMWKFRSMRVDAEAATGAVWAVQGDDRRTAVGAFLRATSLDELPQFWNVLRGDMSLVGPRPERPVFVSRFRRDIPHYMLRHKVKAGITGWAQVNGWRGDTSLDRRIECDLYYIRNWSYLFDWKILLLTLWKGFVNKNAY